MKLPHKKIRAYVNSASYSIRNVNIMTLYKIATAAWMVVDRESKIEHLIGSKSAFLKQIPESIANFHNKTCINHLHINVNITSTIPSYFRFIQRKNVTPARHVELFQLQQQQQQRQ